MLERMIIDISKWIVIIVIFFIAFACSLFLIFSYFAVALKQHDILHPPSNNPESQINTTTRYSNSTIDYQKIVYGNPNGYNTCKPMPTEDYKKIQKIGPRPAIYYFGESFGSTILTTFFTLIGVIVEDRIPVNNQVFSIIYFCFS